MFSGAEEAEEKKPGQDNGVHGTKAGPVWRSAQGLVQERDVARVGAEQQMIYKPRFSRADPSSRSPRDTVLIKMSPAEGKTSAGVTVFKRKMSEMP